MYIVHVISICEFCKLSVVILTSMKNLNLNNMQIVHNEILLEYCTSYIVNPSRGKSFRGEFLRYCT